MSWWQILLLIVGGVLTFDSLFIGLLYISNRPRRGCPLIVPDTKGAGQQPKQSLWTIDGGGS